MASHLLSQSLSALPSTLTPDKAKDVKGKGRAVSSTYPAAVATPTAKDKDEGADTDDSGKKPAVPPAPRAHATRLATGALSTPPNAYKETGHRSAASQEGSGKGKGKAGAEESPAKLAVLKDCRIFVDVRTDEGDDAGGLFVEMLEGLGAKMANRVGSRCTHVVFKNGLMSTLSRYKLLSDPKPHVVGIAWVVECAEQCKKVDESPFRVNLDLVNVAGVNKVCVDFLQTFGECHPLLWR
ncbi:hypothetical protein L226DRAFT_473053 [Lentinus tigrinus ALCF2SS1-7]|uniref:BRCT domain-containing protein n=1 Tax=Lentinus tigrinus ALCF2SS1-6 TaxID=1328759 RepID=A0A5C2RSC6_9APHY|nr:hypothetical protein L227DRAFT_513322 [Lentinus tigrinus ALCF2SS1-6]RPD68660.1 hypothetical protein L226DRAFT_473053 [Lentinus tigrinus ALCF2SS1-7]